MRIFYSHYLTDPYHPAVDMVQRISDELRGMGHEVYVHASNGLSQQAPGAPPSACQQSTANRIKQGAKNILWFAKSIARNRSRYGEDLVAIEGFGPDVVLARQDAYCYSVAKAAVHANIPLVTYADAPVAYETRVFDKTGRWHPPCLVEWIEQWGLEKSREIVTVSNPAANRLRRYGQLPVSVVPNGVDPTRFKEVPQGRQSELKRQLGLTQTVIIGFQGTFKSFHGIDRLGDIIHQLGDLQQVAWLIVGDGPERAGLQREIGEQAKTVFTGRVPADQIGDYLSLMDIAVAPHAKLKGDFYFSPLKILEYAASGAAVVASNQGDIPMLLDNGSAGVIVDSEDTAVWADAIRELVENEFLREELSERARNHVLENRTWKRTAHGIAQILERAIDGSNTVQPQAVYEDQTTNNETCVKRRLSEQREFSKV